MFRLAEWGVLHVQVTSQTPWILAQFEVMCCVSAGGVGGSTCQVTSQTPWILAQFEVMCCVLFQLVEWGVLHIQVTSQTPWISAQFEVVCCVSAGILGGSACTGHEPDSMDLSSI